MATIEHITTAEQLLEAPGLGRCELVRGQLLMMLPAGFEHGRIVTRVNHRLGSFVERERLGVVTGAETGFVIAREPDSVRAPDVGFVRADRAPPGPVFAFFEGPPDLAVEVLSPGDRAGEVLAKVQDWLQAGCRVVWVVDPSRKTVAVHDDRRQAVTLHESDTLTGGDVVPGFSVPVAEIFAT
jgi:Uma2 family endonuclease